jgi:hypothetical protein
MEGLLEPYAGVDRLLGEKYPEVTLATNDDIPMIPPQIQTAAKAVGNREIDAVYLSIGANDIHFGDLVQLCAVAEPCDAFDAAAGGLAVEAVICGVLTLFPIVGIACAALALAIDTALVATLGESWIFDTAAEVFDRGFNGDGSDDALCEDCGLDRDYDFIADALTRTPSSAGTQSRSQVGLGLPVVDANRVSIAPYPDPITKPQADENDPDSFLCGGLEDSFTMFPGISRNETRYMFNNVVPDFEGEISRSAGDHEWHFLEGVSSTNRYHGYCADNRYVRRLDDVLPIQGDIQGVLHPNHAGYTVYRNAILEDWLTEMYGDGSGGAGISPSDSAADANGLAATFIANHDPRDPAVPTAEAGGPYSVEEGDVIALDGSGTDPYGGSLSYAWSLLGSPATAELSHATSQNATLRGIEDGGGRALLTVTNEQGRTATDGATYTVHNVAPSVDAGGNTTVAEGSTVSRTVTVSDPGASDTHTATVTWGDGTSNSVAAAEPPSFGISHVYADNGTYTVQVCVTDDDNGSDCDSFAVTVTNAAASVSVGGSTADEGASVALPTTTFTDPGTLDTHTATVSWGDGTAVQAATVTETPSGPPGSTSGLTGSVGAAHVYADNAVYTVRVCVTDDDSAPSCSSGSVTIRNVAPAASITTVGEGPSFFLPGVSIPLAGGFSDAGTADSHTVGVAWGDGTSSSSTTGAVTVVETPFGPPGSVNGMLGTYTSSHAYAVPGVYPLNPVVTDDDGGPGSVTRSVEVLSPAAAAVRAGDLLSALATDPHVASAARSHLQDALRDLAGTPPSNDGADDKLRDGDPSSGEQKLSAALSDLEAAVASDPSILTKVRLIELVIAQIAESVAVDTLAQVRAAVPSPTPKQAAKLADASALLSQGRALKASDLVRAVTAFRDSVAKSLSAR